MKSRGGRKQTCLKLIKLNIKKMGDAVEALGYDITLPMVDHSLSSATVAGHAAIKLHKDIERLAMVESVMETARACVESQRLLFIFVTTCRGRMNVELVLAADTLHHMPLSEQVLTVLSNTGLQEETTAGQWVSGYRLTVSRSADDGIHEICCTEGVVESECEKISIDLGTVLPSILSFSQKQAVTGKTRLSTKLFLNMRGQEHSNVYKRSVRIDPSLFNCFNQLTPLIAAPAYHRVGDGSDVRDFIFMDTHIHSKETILSTISTHLRTGFRSCPLTDELSLPTKSSNNYKSYKDCLAIYDILVGKGLLQPCTNENDGVGMTLCTSIPYGTLIAQVEASSFDHVDPHNQLSIHFSCMPVILPCMPAISQYLDKFDPSGQWRDMQPETVRERLLQKKSLLRSAQQRLKQSKILEKIGSPGGFESALQRLTDGSDLLGGMQYLMRPGAEHRLDETCDLGTLSQQVVQTAGPELVRDSVGSALLGRYRQDSLL